MYLYKLKKLTQTAEINNSAEFYYVPNLAEEIHVQKAPQEIKASACKKENRETICCSEKSKASVNVIKNITVFLNKSSIMIPQKMKSILQ